MYIKKIEDDIDSHVTSNFCTYVEYMITLAMISPLRIQTTACVQASFRYIYNYKEAYMKQVLVALRLRYEFIYISNCGMFWILLIDITNSKTETSGCAILFLNIFSFLWNYCYCFNQSGDLFLCDKHVCVCVCV